MKTPSLLTIFFVIFLDLLGFGIVIPILPYYSQHFGASAWALGWLMTSYSLMQFIFSPFWGSLSDRFGRKPVLLLSMILGAASLLILGSAHSLLWLFVGRVFAGICGANISTAYAYISDITTEENRAKGMGIIGAGFGLGFIFGPAIGGLLSPYGYEVPIFFAAGLSVINAICAFFILEEPPLSQNERSQNRSRKLSLRGIQSLLEVKMTRFAVILFFLVTFAVTQMEVSFALFMKVRHGYGAKEAGVLLAVLGLVMAGVQGGAMGRLSRRYDETALIVGGSFICAFSLIGFAFAQGPLGAVFSLIFLGLGHGVLHPSLSSLASKGAPPRQRGATMGVFQSAGSLARVLGPPCAGFLYDSFNRGSPFYFGALVLGVCFILACSAQTSLAVDKVNASG